MQRLTNPLVLTDRQRPKGDFGGDNLRNNRQESKAEISSDESKPIQKSHPKVAKDRRQKLVYEINLLAHFHL